MRRTKGAFGTMSAPVRELFHARSWSGTLHNYTPSSADGEWYDSAADDKEWDEEPDVGVDIVVEWTTDPETLRVASGRELTGDVSINVDPTEGDFRDGDSEDERASEITDDDSGVRYRVVRVVNEHNGVLVLDAERLT